MPRMLGPTQETLLSINLYCAIVAAVDVGAGHDAQRSRSGICSVLGGSFNMSHRNYQSECPHAIGALVRTARGVALQHDPR